MIFRLMRFVVLAPVRTVQAARSIGQRLIGWWVGRRRGWSLDTRDYGARSGYVVRYTNRSYWWDGRHATRTQDE